MPDSNPPPDPFEAFRRLWGPLGMPVPGMAMPTLDPEEVAKRIADLRALEAWLTMNLNMVRLSVQGLEVQKATLQAMRGNVDPGKAAAQGAAALAELAKAAGSAEHPMIWPWTMMQQAMNAARAPTGATEQSATRDEKKNPQEDR
jgi:hypothetical protein